MFIRTTTLSLLALAMATSPAWAETPAVAQRADVSLALANQLLDATLAACHGNWAEAARRLQ